MSLQQTLDPSPALITLCTCPVLFDRIHLLHKIVLSKGGSMILHFKKDEKFVIAPEVSLQEKLRMSRTFTLISCVHFSAQFSGGKGASFSWGERPKNIQDH